MSQKFAVSSAECGTSGSFSSFLIFFIYLGGLLNIYLGETSVFMFLSS